MTVIFDRESKEVLQLMRERNAYRDMINELMHALGLAMVQVYKEQSEGIEPPDWYPIAQAAFAKASGE